MIQMYCLSPMKKCVRYHVDIILFILFSLSCTVVLKSPCWSGHLSVAAFHTLYAVFVLWIYDKKPELNKLMTLHVYSNHCHVTVSQILKVHQHFTSHGCQAAINLEDSICSFDIMINDFYVNVLMLSYL